MKALICIVDFGIDQRNYLLRQLIVFDRMDKLDYQFDVIIYHTHPLDLPSFDKLNITKKLCPESLGDLLTWEHRVDISKNQNKYDLFIYTENDLMITQGNLDNFIQESCNLPDEYIAGFIHYEYSPFSSECFPKTSWLMPLSDKFAWDGIIEIDGNKYLTLHNQHQACYILTRKHLKRAINSGNYNSQPIFHQFGSQYYHYKESAASLPYTICGLKKVIPISKLEDFMIWHMPNKYGYKSNGEFITLKQLEEYCNEKV